MVTKESRAVIRFDEIEDSKGRKILKPIYLVETPVAEIERLNKKFRGRR